MRRREWLRLVGTSAASLAATSVACGDNLPPAAASVVAAVLEPSDTGFLVALYDERIPSVVVEIRDGSGDLVTMASVELAPSGVATFDELAPATDYEVTVVQRGRAPIVPLRVRTAPRADDPRAVRIAVSADFDPHPSFESTLVEQLLATEPDLFVSLGDFPYCDNGPDVALDVPAYRHRHYQARSSSAMRTLYGGVGVRSIYDDHEFRNDWNPDFVAQETARYLAALQVWDEFFPVRDRTGNVRYRSWRQGAHLECFLLDCRRFRSSESLPDTPTKTMLGATQLQWLESGVRASTATFKLIFSSVPLDYGLGIDHWRTYTAERDALLASLVGIPGVLFVSADQHYFAAHRHAYGVREIQVGPLARGLGTYGEDAPGVLFRAARLNAGLFEVEGEVLRVSGLGADGERFYEETLTPDLLRPA